MVDFPLKNLFQILCRQVGQILKPEQARKCQEITSPSSIEMALEMKTVCKMLLSPTVQQEMKRWFAQNRTAAEEGGLSNRMASKEKDKLAFFS